MNTKIYRTVNKILFENKELKHFVTDYFESDMLLSVTLQINPVGVFLMMETAQYPCI